MDLLLLLLLIPSVPRTTTKRRPRAPKLADAANDDQEAPKATV